MIVVDTLRADHLGAYGYDRPTSPNLDAMARRGILYTHAHSVTSWTNPSIEALFTGEEPRVLQPGASAFIAQDQLTLAARFRALGYATAAIVANPVLSPELGFGQGFDTYIGVAGWSEGFRVPPKQPAEQVNRAALQWLADSSAVPKNRPWFLYLHYMDPHWPYQPPNETLRAFWRQRNVDPDAASGPLNQRIRERIVQSADDVAQATDLYDAAVAHLDDQLRRFFDSLDPSVLDRTIICIMADHGEELGDHGRYLHAHTLYEELLHIPLLVVLPDRRAAQTNESFVQIYDVGRTLLELANVADPAFPGTSLVGGRRPMPLHADLVGAAIQPSHRRALIDGTSKLIETTEGQFLLFDLVSDPHENTNLAMIRAKQLMRLRAAATRSDGLSGRTEIPIKDSAARERLRALGYDF